MSGSPASATHHSKRSQEIYSRADAQGVIVGLVRIADSFARSVQACMVTGEGSDRGSSNTVRNRLGKFASCARESGKEREGWRMMFGTGAFFYDRVIE